MTKPKEQQLADSAADAAAAEARIDALNKGEPQAAEQEAPRIMPNMKGVATADLVQQVEGNNNSFKASYINWSRTMQLLRDNAPDWSPELVPDKDNNVVHVAPGVGGYLMIRFRNMRTGATTAAVPQAIMDNRNNSVPLEKISARDVTDTHRRGVCLAAAFHFGLAYELWAKMPLESGYHGEDEHKEEGGGNDFTILELAIQQAPDLDTLQKVFGRAWTVARGDKKQQDRFKELYEGRKIDFEEAK